MLKRAISFVGRLLNYIVCRWFRWTNRLCTRPKLIPLKIKETISINVNPQCTLWVRNDTRQIPMCIYIDRERDVKCSAIHMRETDHCYESNSRLVKIVNNTNYATRVVVEVEE